ncbi:MAG: YggS family pyridoxal phosphate-dependent enzyme [Lentisphaerae bacterium]|nr:YggS family pyridoxal phosphate-dependent enzyme [Lentisphaerota bacterium]
MVSGMAERLQAVVARMARACERVGRDPAGVRMVAVSKTHGPANVRAACELGVTVFGENRVQEARQKIPLCPGQAVWHLVGHLQTNKVRPALALFEMIHSVDSLKLLLALDVAADQAGRRLPVCLEVNVAGEASKFGLPPDQVAGVLRETAHLRRLDVVGLMAIPPVSVEEGATWIRLGTVLFGRRDSWKPARLPQGGETDGGDQ